MIEIPKDEGLRERKKRETLQRIAHTGLKLFLKNGYEGTTLDEIAAEAGIARRTFFYYFKSTEEILLPFMDGGFAKAIRPIILAQSTDQTPLSAAKNSILQLMSALETDHAIAVDKLLGSTDALRARMQSVFLVWSTQHSRHSASCGRILHCAPPFAWWPWPQSAPCALPKELGGKTAGNVPWANACAKASRRLKRRSDAANAP